MVSSRTGSQTAAQQLLAREFNASQSSLEWCRAFRQLFLAQIAQAPLTADQVAQATWVIADLIKIRSDAAGSNRSGLHIVRGCSGELQSEFQAHIASLRFPEEATLTLQEIVSGCIERAFATVEKTRRTASATR